MQPHFISDQSAPWMGEFHKQLVRGKHVLLYGNVLDHFYITPTGDSQGHYVSVPEFLRLYFGDEGYEVIGHYDIVDGLTFSDPPVMRPVFDGIVTAAKGGVATELLGRLGCVSTAETGC